MPEVDVTSTDTGALDVQEDLTHCQISTPLHNLQAGFCLSNPQIMLWVCVDTDICLRRRNCCCAHLAALCLKSNDWEEKMSKEGISMIYQRNRAARKERRHRRNRQLPVLRGISIRGCPRRAARCTPLPQSVTPCPASRLEWAEKPTNGNPPTPREQSFRFGALATGTRAILFSGIYPILLLSCGSHAAKLTMFGVVLRWTLAVDSR